MGKIWLDVTTILSWNRPAVGIVRVEAECARFALAERSDDIRFCRYEHGTGYLPVSTQAVEQTIERISQGHPARAHLVSDAHSSFPEPRRPLEKRLGALVQRLTSYLPDATKVRLLTFLGSKRESAGAVINAARELRRALRTWRTSRSVGLTETPGIPLRDSVCCPFATGDVYMTLGLDWDQKELPVILELKAAINFKAIFCCYDIIPVKFPHLCVGDVAAIFARYFSDVAWCADEILCISECSKRDLVDLLRTLGAPTPQATVFRLGSNISVANGAEVSENIKKTVGDRFVLFVSTIERRKNHETLYRAYTRLVDKGETDLPKLIFVGMPGWGVIDFLADIRLDPRVQGLIENLSNVSDSDLAWLYRNALFTVFPSLYEGWGLAVAESLAAGKFCLASDQGSIPEVGEDLVEYLDPWDVPLWAERLKWYLDNPTALKNAEERIRMHYVPSHWDAAAKSVFERAYRLVTPTTALQIAPNGPFNDGRSRQKMAADETSSRTEAPLHPSMKQSHTPCTSATLT
ncbi:glycosyltransferase family 4 protein [Phreatobacter sp. AB_2022a]|uniref:glycosyltransferase family 4 protein n=1 Tax=Phreatobacter sp. AB_2022a TaxID=3003134 RepID=UPI00228730DF|nr:glycosyltransferase family 1 protein [Phreatobacter sp. AB_2022a]MCZ0733002.1 glycosyltransferase family 1 protein [Phreatobacter sp. AB_2022a]